jgi:methionyl-tRNA formyltransferase
MTLRFAITATDRYLSVFETLVDAGWQAVKLFTGVTDERLHHNKAVIKLAQSLALPVQFSRIQETDLQALSELGCDVLVVASYQWRIPEWQPYLKYAINFHPSPLPMGRGPEPLAPAILSGEHYWGVSCHKLTPEFDAGDVLDEECFPIDEEECHERLDLKVQMAAKRLAMRVGHDFIPLWDHAMAQGPSTYFNHWNNEDRHLDFSLTVDEILRCVRAFGTIETIAVIGDMTFYVRRAVGWKEAHGYQPGSLAFISGLYMVVAVQDGYIGIVEWSLLDPDVAVGKIGR